MPKDTLPSSVRLLAVALVVAAVLGSGAAFPLYASESSDSFGVAPVTHLTSNNIEEVPGGGGMVVASADQSSGANPSGGTNPTLGVLATVSLPDGSRPDGVAVDSANGNVYVAESGSDKVGVINESTQQVTQVVVGSNPSGVVFDNQTSEIFVANFFANDVKVINTTTNSVTATIFVGSSPVGLAWDSVNGNIYVTNQHSDSVSVIAATGVHKNTVIATIGVGAGPIAAAFDSANQDLYVANSGSANVSVVNTTTEAVTGTISVGATPLGVAFDTANGYVYVANRFSNNTTVISGIAVVTSVAVGADPWGIAYDPGHSLIGVVSNGTHAVDFISDSTNTWVANVSVGDHPVGIAYDVINHDDYVSNANSSNVSVIGTSLAPPYAITFNETGLSSGTNWSVMLVTSVTHSTTSSITFSQPNGSYAYSVGSIIGFAVAPRSGSVSIHGFPVVVNVIFSLVVYPVTFEESGLPSGTLWSVTLNGTPGASMTSSIAFSAGNGTYPYVVAHVAGYSAGPSLGNVSVNGASAQVAITFTAVGIPTYTVTFTESGLPSGSSWSVTLNGTPESSVGSSLTYTEPNGSYPYMVGTVTGYNVTPSSGSVTVNGGSQGVSLTFSSGPVSSSSAPSSGTPLWEYLLIGVVIAAVVIGVALFLRRRKAAPTQASPAPAGNAGNQP
ncbi:MAG: YncE family protein [Thermoplasmata archaeon]